MIDKTIHFENSARETTSLAQNAFPQQCILFFMVLIFYIIITHLKLRAKIKTRTGTRSRKNKKRSREKIPRERFLFFVNLII